MKGKVLAINTGSTSTKVGYYVDGNTVLVRNLELSAQEVLRFDSVLEQGDLRKGIVMDFLRDAGVGLGDIDIVMARGGLFAPAVTGVYSVNADMREVLLSGRAFFHALNSRAVVRRRTAFIAPTEVYPGENELDSLAENGYLILAGSARIHRYDKNRLLEDEETVQVIRS